MRSESPSQSRSTNRPTSALIGKNSRRRIRNALFIVVEPIDKLLNPQLPDEPCQVRCDRASAFALAVAQASIFANLLVHMTELIRSRWFPVVLLTVANIFMTFA